MIVWRSYFGELLSCQSVSNSPACWSGQSMRFLSQFELPFIILITNFSNSCRMQTSEGQSQNKEGNIWQGSTFADSEHRSPLQRKFRKKSKMAQKSPFFPQIFLGFFKNGISLNLIKFDNKFRCIENGRLCRRQGRKRLAVETNGHESEEEEELERGLSGKTGPL